MSKENPKVMDSKQKSFQSSSTSTLSSIGQKFFNILTSSSAGQKALEDKIEKKITTSSADQKAFEDEIKKKIDTVNGDTSSFLIDTMTFVKRLSSENWQNNLEEFKKKKKDMEDKIHDRYLSYQELEELVNNKTPSQECRDYCFDRIWRRRTQVTILEQWIIMSGAFFTFGSKVSHEPSTRDEHLESQFLSTIKKIFLIIFISDYKLASLNQQSNGKRFSYEWFTKSGYSIMLYFMGELLKSLKIQLEKLPALNKEQLSEMKRFINACYDSYNSVIEREPLTQIPEEFKPLQQKAIHLLKLYNGYPPITCSFYSDTQVFFYTARKKDFVSIVFPSPEARDYVIQILGGDGLTFSNTELIELKKILPKIILHKIEGQIQYLQTFGEKPGTPQERTLYIPAYVENDQVFIVFKNQIFSDKFKEVFLSNNQMLIKAQSVNENLLRISNSDFASGQKTITLNTQLCLKNVNIYSFLRPHLPKELTSLVTKYAHECETESADDGCGHEVLPSYSAPKI